VRETVETIAGAKIIAPEPTESDSRGGILLQSAGMLSTSKDEVVLLLPFHISDNAFQEILRRTQVIPDRLKLPADTLELRLQSSVRKTVHCATKLPSNSMIIIWPRTNFMTVPKVVPCLTIRLRLAEGQHNKGSAPRHNGEA
jgi:hypothetical protein